MNPNNPAAMSPESDGDAPLQLARDPGEVPSAPGRHSWKVLVVDDEPEVHDVTRLALDGFSYQGVPLEFISAYSGEEAKRCAAEHPDIALILLDVVMETDHAGLDVIRHIREELGNRFVRIVLRTGQPGQAPEYKVITQYDINDYKHKTELTSQKMFTTVYTSISSYRDLVALDSNRRGLEKVIEASARIFEMRSMTQFTEGVLEQLTALLYLDHDALIVRASAVAAAGQDSKMEIVAAIGSYRPCVGRDVLSCLEADVAERIQRTLTQQTNEFGDHYFAGYHSGDDGSGHVLYVTGATPIAESRLIELFIRNVSIAYANVNLLETALSGSASPGGSRTP